MKEINRSMERDLKIQCISIETLIINLGKVTTKTRKPFRIISNPFYTFSRLSNVYCTNRYYHHNNKIFSELQPRIVEFNAVSVIEIALARWNLLLRKVIEMGMSSRFCSDIPGVLFTLTVTSPGSRLAGNN